MGKMTNKMAEVEQKKPDEKEGVKIEPYKVFGRDFSLTDPDYIKYYKVRMNIMAVRYQLLGRVNKNGVYQIPAVIKQELVGMFKEIEDMDHDWYRASAVYMKKYYYFHVKLTMLENNMAKASLYLSEFVDDFLEDEYIVSHIADFIDVYDDNFRIKVRQAFNLVDVAVPMSDVQVPNIAVVIQDAIDLEMLVAGLYDIASQIYLMRMLKLLEGAGEKGQAIIRRYKELIIDKDENDINEKHRNIKFKSLLDRAIDEFGGIEKLEVNKQDLKDIVVEMNNSIKAITNMQKRPGAIEIMKTDKGKEKDKTAGNKPAKDVFEKMKKKEESKKSDKKDSAKKKDNKDSKDKGEEKKGIFGYDYGKKESSKDSEKTTTKIAGKIENKEEKKEEPIEEKIEDEKIDKEIPVEEENEDEEIDLIDDPPIEMTSSEENDREKEENEELDKNKDEDEGDSVEFVEETVSIQIESETSEEKLNEEQLQNNQENIENENDEIDENGL